MVRHVTHLRLLPCESQKALLETQIALHERFDPLLSDSQLPLTRFERSL